VADVAAVAEPEKPETPMDRAERFATAFRRNANRLAMAYGGPVYLVGSMLTSLKPGDVDIRIMLTREDLVLWFGEDFDSHKDPIEWSPAQWNLEREQLKQSRRQSKRWRGYPARRFDIQFQCSLMSDTDGLPIENPSRGPRLRLDTTPLDYFRAGWSNP